MQLKKLELRGFKSFADETCFQFDPGLTALVGPNGCGKSNVVDSVRWVLGEMSPKSLRGDELLDVIFNGSEIRQATGCAEVSLTFSNEDGRLPIEYAEVTVTRRLYRSGESEYLLNKQACRLKDIRELFMDTGVGTDFYSVVEQGRIETVLQSNPKDRRSLFDEAAGISKYKAKKREAEGKLERATQDLARVTDIIKELDSETRSLKIQASKAEKHKRLTAELRRKRAQLALRAFSDLKKKKVETETQLETLQRERDDATAHLMTARHDVELCESRARTADESVRSGESACQTVLNQLAATQQGIGAETERIAELTAAIAARNAEMENVRARIVELSARREQIKAELADVLAATVECDAQLAEAERLLTEFTNACLETAHELERKKAEVMDVLQKRSGYQNELTAISLERKNLFGRRERNDSRATAISGDLRAVGDALAVIQQELAGLDAAIAAARANLDNQDNHLAQLRAHQQKLLANISSARDSLSKKTSRRETLEEMETSMAGVEPGARNVILQAQAEPGAMDGVLGLFGKLLDVDAEHVRAVEAALGDMANAIVARTTEAADRLLEFAKTVGAGDVTVIDLSSLPAAPSPEPAVFANPFEPSNLTDMDQAQFQIRAASPYGQAVSERSFSQGTPQPLPGPSAGSELAPSLSRWQACRGSEPATAAQLVRAPETLKPLVDLLLSQYVVVATAEEAAALVAQGFLEPDRHGCDGACPPAVSLVALTGELVPRPGILRTARSTEAQPGLLSRKVELRHLSAAIDRETGELAALEHEMKLLESDLAHVHKQAESLRHSIYDNSMLTVEKRKERESLEKRQSALQAELEIIRIEVAEIDAQTVALTKKENSVTRVIGELDLLQKTLEATATELVTKERDYARRKSDAAARKTELQIQAAETAQRRTFLSKEDTSCAQRVKEAQDSADAAAAAVAQMQTRATAAEAEIRNKRRTLESLQAEAQNLEGRLTALRADLADARTQLAARQQTANAGAERVARLDGDVQNARMLLQEHSLRLESLEDRVRDELGVELEQLAAELAAQQAAEQQQQVEAASRRRPPDGDSATPTPAGQDAAQPTTAIAQAPGGESPQIASGTVCAHAPALAALLEVDPAALAAEIEEIRRKLEPLANVNLSAFDQLKEVEQRAMFLKAQQEDLVKTKGQLEEFIRRVNRECRDRFMTTLTALRENFNAMFRKLFGGGKVDIVLEENVDPLDSGIEIMAKPPGKELTSISLMSGGEKSLTTVALVMGIFMLKPSPFCILDEADAALDETNIDRFVALVKEFSANTQFVLITHNKRTMSEASIIYGITMEEPGVSKKVSVRFVEEAEALLDSATAVAATIPVPVLAPTLAF